MISFADQQTVGNNDIAKRQRRWNSEGLKIPEPQSTDVSTTPKDIFQPALRRSFSRSDSTVGEEMPKERVGELMFYHASGCIVQKYKMFL